MQKEAGLVLMIRHRTASEIPPTFKLTMIKLHHRWFIRKRVEIITHQFHILISRIRFSLRLLNARLILQPLYKFNGKDNSNRMATTILPLTCNGKNNNIPSLDADV